MSELSELSELHAPEDSVGSGGAHLEQAVGIRRVVGQAQGILMERHGLTPEQAVGLTPEQALGRLRSASRQSGYGVQQVAAELTRPGAGPSRPSGRSRRPR